MISQTESAVHICVAAAISTALFAFGLNGKRSHDGKTKRARRWPSMAGGAVGVVMTVLVALTDQFRLDNAFTIGITVSVLATAFVTGLGFLRVGLRGLRVGDHPYCSKCGFDLFGKPPGSCVCNECGANLDEPLSVVVGERQRRMIPLCVGLFALIVAAAVTVPVSINGYRSAVNFNWNRYKTDTGLLNELRASGTQYWPAQQELYRRLEEGSLGTASMQRLIDILNAAPQPKGAPAYMTPLSTTAYIAERGWELGKFDEAFTRPFLRDALDLHLELAPQTAQGHALRYWICSPDFNLARDRPLAGTTFSFSHREILIDGKRVAENAVDLSPFCLTDNAYITLNALGTRVRAEGLPKALPLGPVSVEMRMTVTATLATANRPTLVESRDIVLTGITTIVDPSAMRCPPVLANNTPAHPELPIDDPANATTAPVDNELATPTPLPGCNVSAEGGKSVLRVSPGAGVMGGGLLGDAFLRAEGRDTPLGPIFITANGDGTIPINIPTPAGAQLVIVPTPERGTEIFAPVPTYQTTIVIPID